MQICCIMKGSKDIDFKNALQSQTFERMSNATMTREELGNMERYQKAKSIKFY